jgi:UDPglucose 6-dehydrogenase
MVYQAPVSKIAIIGTGYVGMACAIGFAELGHDVVGYDILSERIDRLQQGITPYRENGLGESLQRHLRAARVAFVDDLRKAVEGADYIIVAVGTPSHNDGRADLSAIYDVVDQLSQCRLDNAMVVLRSTVPPGTTRIVADRLRGRAEVAYAPEFLREGSAVADFLQPDRVIVGAESAGVGRAYLALFAHLDRPMLVMSFLEAELAKASSNAFLAMKISFANQVANLCDILEADALEVLDAVGHDRRIGRLFLHPGIGFGGPCFEKDLKSLIHVMDAAQTDASLLKATLDVNDRQPGRVVSVLKEELGEDLSGLHVGVWGLTFKGGTSDLRDSLALRVVEEIITEGGKVSAFDPAYDKSTSSLHFDLVESALAAAESDVLVVLTDWPQFRSVAAGEIAARVKKRLVIDGRNILDAQALTSAGMTLRGIGRRRSASAIELMEAG